MLPEAIPLAELRTLARRLIEPYLEYVEHKSLVDKNRVLRALAAADPAGGLRTLEEMQNIGPGLTRRSRARSSVRWLEPICEKPMR